jgi:hypothetical protein
MHRISVHTPEPDAGWNNSPGDGHGPSLVATTDHPCEKAIMGYCDKCPAMIDDVTFCPNPGDACLHCMVLRVPLLKDTTWSVGVRRMYIFDTPLTLVSLTSVLYPGNLVNESSIASQTRIVCQRAVSSTQEAHL